MDIYMFNSKEIPSALVLGCNTPHGICVLSDWIEEQTGYPLVLDPSGWSDYSDCTGDGEGYSNGNGYGDGNGYGYGYSNGNDYGYGNGYGDGDGYGSGYGYGYINGNGFGFGNVYN